jgi:hypothetical protein
MIKLIVVIAALALGGCAAYSDGYFVRQIERYTWYQEGPSLPAIFVHAESAKVRELCPQNSIAIACTVRNEAAGTCIIYHTPKKLQEGGEMWRHELKHCAGYNHKEV